MKASLMMGTIALGVGTVLAQDAFSPNVEIVDSATKTAVELDLSSLWDRTDLSSVDVVYSADGWEKEAPDSGRTVTLQLTPADGGAAVDVAVNLDGRGTYVWTPENVERKKYVLKHLVKNGSAVVGGETLTAYFSFENAEMRATEAEVRAAALGISQDCTIANDADHPWQPIGGAGEGIASPVDVASACSFQVNGQGTLCYEWALDAGVTSVTLDGESARSYEASSGWSEDAFSVTTEGEHVFAFSVTAERGPFKLRNVRWVTSDAVYLLASSSKVSVDLRTGVRSLRKRVELLPFTYSSTNFVGITGATAEAIARVALVQITGEGEDLAQWTDEIPGSEIVLHAEPGEGTVVWEGKSGVWKATFDIMDEGGASIHEETAIFDMRKFERGLIIMLK